MANVLQLLGVVAVLAGLCLFGLGGLVVACGLVSLVAGLVLELRGNR